MTLTLPKTCSLGGSKTGLVGTIGVELLNPDGTTHIVRSTAGIYEIGGGCYGKQIGFNDDWLGSIKWDTGGGSPVYAIEEYIYYENNPNVDVIKVKTDNLPSGIAKNEALPKFDFLMVLSSDHVTGATGKTVTGEIMKDGNAFTAITNTITEVSNGMYTIADGFTQTEMNADVITLKFENGDCDPRIITIITT